MSTTKAEPIARFDEQSPHDVGSESFSDSPEASSIDESTTQGSVPVSPREPVVRKARKGKDKITRQVLADRPHTRPGEFNVHQNNPWRKAIPHSPSGATHASLPEPNRSRPPGATSMSLKTHQVQRLMAVLNSMVIVNGRIDQSRPLQPPLPTFACRPIDFLDVLLRLLREAQIQVDGVRLYGGAASYVISESASFFNDIDLMIHVNFNATALHLYLDSIKTVVLKSLREIVRDVLTKCPNALSPTMLDDGTLTSAYIAKMYKHTADNNQYPEDNNIWSLFSFNNFQGRNIEVKFVHTLARQYKFSIDSWQIDLSNSFLMHSQHCVVGQSHTEHITTTAYSLYPNLHQALEDVEKKQIRVVDPELVRGGCFLRYADLVHKRYQPAEKDKGKVQFQELKMLARFLTDFRAASEQSKAIEIYLQSHMGACGPSYKVGFLRLLRDIVERLESSAPNAYPQSACRTLQSVISAKISESKFG